LSVRPDQKNLPDHWTWVDIPLGQNNAMKKLIYVVIFICPFSGGTMKVPQWSKEAVAAYTKNLDCVVEIWEEQAWIDHIEDMYSELPI